jgi:predicted TIM-barrel enzyme
MKRLRFRADPFRDMHRFLKEVKELGFVGVQVNDFRLDPSLADTTDYIIHQNFPTVGLIDGVFRQNLEETGMDYEKEVEMIRIAHGMDLLTTPYVFNVDEAIRMTQAGADVIVAHMGLTTSGTIGAQTTATVDDCVKRVQDIRDAAFEVNQDILVMCHGGPIASPDDARYIIERTKGVHGFFGASSLERLPVETAMKEVTQMFKAIRL